MRKTPFIQLRSILLMACLAVIMFPVSVAATQGHSGIEGVHVHQLAHLYFIFSMGTLIYWIRRRELVREKGWRYIQYSAIFFILWNIDAFAVHFIDEQISTVVVSQGDPFQLHISTSEGFEWIRYLYYLAKLDHLLCVPAMILLYLALRSLLRESSPADKRGLS
jgi:hypothetical protein